AGLRDYDDQIVSQQYGEMELSPHPATPLIDRYSPHQSNYSHLVMHSPRNSGHLHLDVLFDSLYGCPLVSSPFYCFAFWLQVWACFQIENWLAFPSSWNCK